MNYCMILLFLQLSAAEWNHINYWAGDTLSRGLQSWKVSGLDGEMSACSKSANNLYLHSKNLTTWAISMIEASSKGPSGIIYGNRYEMGHYDQCVRTVSPGSDGWGARYSLVSIIYQPHSYPNTTNKVKSIPSNTILSGHNQNLNDMSSSIWDIVKLSSQTRGLVRRDEIVVAVCVPHECTPLDIESSLYEALINEFNVVGLDVNVSIMYSVSYWQGLPPTLSVLNPFLLLCSALIIMVLISTAVNFCFISSKHPESLSSLDKLFQYFSAIKNLDKLMNKPSSEFSIISGLKVWSMFIIIFGHRLMITFSQPVYNTLENEMSLGKLLTTMIYNGTIVVNTFLLITGFLTYNKLLRDIKKGKRITIFSSIKRRWLRLTPLYIFVLCGIIFFVPELDGGPLGLNGLWDINNCAHHWWTHILYINNYVYPRSQCLIPSWYLAVDMQLYIVCTLVGYITMKNYRYGRNTLLSLLFLSIVIPPLITSIYNYKGATLLSFVSIKDLFNETDFLETYIPTHARASPYFLGMATALLYEELKFLCLSTSKQCILVTTFTFLLLLGGTSMGAWFLYDNEYRLIPHVLYSLISKVSWSLPISWIIVAYSAKGVMKNFLDLDVYHAFNNLSYSVLLIHTPLQLYLAGANRTPIYYDSVTMIWMASGDLVICYVAALLIFIFVEAPFSNWL